jgi:hypothetical protein
LPLAIGMGHPGREIEGRMAVVILGDLLSSMALNLLVLPTLALRYARLAPSTDELGTEPPPAARSALGVFEMDRRAQLAKVLAHVAEDPERQQRPRL